MDGGVKERREEVTKRRVSSWTTALKLEAPEGTT